MTDTVIFDIGGVLVDFRQTEFFRDRGFEGEMAEILKAHTMQTDLWCELDRGVFTMEEIIELLVHESPEYAEEIRVCMSDLRGIVGRRDTAIPWIRSLKEKGLKVYYLSNFSEKAYLGNLDAMDFLSECDGGILSYREQMIKPNPDIYKRLIEMYGLIPEHCVFIDDTWRNLPMAEHFGIRTIRYTTQKETEEALLALTGKA